MDLGAGDELGDLDTVSAMLACFSAGDPQRQLDPDLVIVEVRGDNHLRDRDRHYQNHYIMFLYFRDGLVHRWREFSNPDVYRRAVSP